MLIVEYQHSWQNSFEDIQDILVKQLSGIRVSIEHIGRTAVKDLAAKPIIDIDLIYYEQESFKLITVGLEKIGNFHNGDQGIKGRAVFKRQQEGPKHPVLDRISHHLYVCHNTNEELKRHLIFRDFLRQDERWRRQYQELKYTIAQQANEDRKVYANLKQTMARSFIEEAIHKALASK